MPMRPIRFTLRTISFGIAITCSLTSVATLPTSAAHAQDSAVSTYDPLAVPSTELAPPVDLDAVGASGARNVPIRVYFPKEITDGGSGKFPVVLFSHGLGGSRENNPHLGQHWAKRGYVAIFMQHPGSDDSVWKNAPMLQRMSGMREAASAENFKLRVKDVDTVLDNVELWSQGKQLPSNSKTAFARLDASRVGMSGHSFGAITTQAVSGQRFPLNALEADPRIKAAVVLSPSVPKMGRAETAFGSVSIPWLLMTGTEDISPIGDIDVEDRLKVFESIAPGNKYELVLNGGKHSFPGDRALPRERGAFNPNHPKLVRGLSAAFWDAHLKGSAEAKQWLEGNGAQSLLEKGDTFKVK